MDVLKICDGLWRWTAPHPDWKPGEGWLRDVGCVYYEAPEDIVLIDPLVPTDEEETFWTALDRDVERLGRPVVVLITVSWHERSAEGVASRYGARLVRRGDAAPLPSGIEAFETNDAAGEWVVWIPEHRALVPGDVLIAEADGLRVCPFSWLPTGAEPDVFLASLSPLTELPIDRVLVSHGKPILAAGSAELERALSHAHQSSATDR